MGGGGEGAGETVRGGVGGGSKQEESRGSLAGAQHSHQLPACLLRLAARDRSSWACSLLLLVGRRHFITLTLCYTALHSTVLHCSTLWCATLYRVTLHYIALHCDTALYYATLH